ncbi:MAG: TPM domain-containing protein [Methanothrix sp.]|nr:TPM domain-containing protein [Methanothrix sp.]
MIIFLIVQSGSASDYPDFVGYVNDYANLLSAPQASALNQELRDFDNRTTIEVAVVTVNSIGSENPQDYAVNLANYWGVGKRNKNNGVIFLVAMQSHDIWIEVGTGLSGQFSDRQIQQIVDNVIIPQFRANRPDLGVINGVHSIVSHFDGSGTSQTVPIIPPSQDRDLGNPNFFRLAASWLLVVLLVILSILGIRRWSQAKKNNARISDFKKLLDDLVDKEATALKALKELKANYAPSIWQSAEESFNLVDHEKLELELLGAQRTSDRGLISARAAQSQISEMESSFEMAQKNADVPISRLAEAKRAQQECAAILAGLDAAFLQAEKETTDEQISMATRMNLETARHIHQEALTLAGQPANTVDWIILLERLVELRNSVEQVSKDAVRDRAIAEKIQGQNPDELLAKMKQTLDAAEKTLGRSGAAQWDLKAARAEYDRAQEYRSGRVNTIDLYLIMTSINSNVERGHQHHKKALEEARLMAEARAQERATAVHHTGFGSSGSRSFGGGRMGGGSHGGGKW